MVMLMLLVLLMMVDHVRRGEVAEGRRVLMEIRGKHDLASVSAAKSTTRRQKRWKPNGRRPWARSAGEEEEEGPDKRAGRQEEWQRRRG